MATMLEKLRLHPIQNADLLYIGQVDPPSEADQSCLREVAAVLRKHGAETRFGLCLLHRHFEVYEDEALVERCDLASRTLTIAPIKKTDIDPSRLVQTNWRFDVAGKEVSCDISCEEEKDGHTRTHDLEQL